MLTRDKSQTSETHKLTLIGDKAEQILCLPSPDYIVSNYLIDILRSRSEHFITPVWIMEASQSCLIFNKSGYLSLEQSILSRNLQREDLFHFLWQTVQILELCEDSLLECQNLILDPRYLFFRKAMGNESRAASFDPHFIYIPVESKQLEPYTEVETAYLADLFEYCIDYAETQDLLQEEEIGTLRQFVMSDRHRLRCWLEEKSLNPSRIKRKKIRHSSTPRMTKHAKPDPLSAEDKIPDSTQQSRIQWLIACNIVLLFAMNISLGLALKQESFFYYALTAIGLFLLIASNAYILSDNRKQKSVSDTRFERERREALIQSLDSEAMRKRIDAVFEDASHKNPTSEDSDQIAYLYQVSGSAVAAFSSPDERHKLGKPSAVILNREFYIGSDRDRCDFKPPTKNLSALHARITRHDGTYVLTDLASETGTYLNNIRLHYYEDYLLFSGALIRIGDSNYIFIMEETNETTQ